jgi:hypothetical protein
MNDHAMYTTLSGLRGSGRPPTTSDAPIAETPPAANTRPRSADDPPRTFLTMNGISTKTGPRKNNIPSDDAAIIPSNHRWERT